VIAVDTETYLIGPGQVAPKMVCLSWARSPVEYGLISGGQELLWNCPFPFGREDRNEWLQSAVLVDVDQKQRIESLLMDDLVVGQNLSYDFGVLSNYAPQLERVIWDLYEKDHVRDTMIRAMLRAIKLGFFKYDPEINKRPSFSLNELSQQHLNRKLDKSTWRLRYKELDGVPFSRWPVGAIHYATGDAVTTLDVFGELPEPYPDEWLQMRAAWWLHLQSAWGMETDQEAVLKLTNELKKTVRGTTEALQKIGFIRSNGVRNMALIRQAGEEAFETLGEIAPRTKTEMIQLDKDARERVRGIDHRIDLYHDSLSDKKILNDFVPKLKPLVNPRIKILVLTGRVSQSNPNLQQQKQKGGVRECFVPREGRVYIQVDISKAEMCAIAELCYVKFGFSELGESIKRGVDPHTAVAATLAGVEYGEALEALSDESHPRYAEMYQARQLGKIANFGLWGGMGAETFVGHCRRNGVIITLAESWAIKNTMKRLFPEMGLYFDEVGALGRGHTRAQLYSGRVRGDLNFTNGCNTQFQGLIVDAAKEAGYELTRHYRNPTGYAGGVLYGCNIVNFIHDEWISEADKARAEAARRAKEQVIVDTIQKWLPHVPASVDSKIMSRWTK